MTFLLNIDVPDVAAAERFYTAAFGLTVGRRFGTDFVELAGWPAPDSRHRPRTRPTDGSPCWPIRSATASACCSSASAATTHSCRDAYFLVSGPSNLQ